MSASRRDYEAAADALRAGHREEFHADAHEALDLVARRLMEHFAAENPHFNRALFLRAAGTE